LFASIEKYWNLFHWEYIFLKGRYIFDYEVWFTLKNIFFGLDIGYFVEEIFRFLSYELPKESFKFIPIYFYLKHIWLSQKNN